MSTQEKITEFLIEKFKPMAIVLHGSRASGRNRINSDWDLYLFVDKKPECISTLSYENEQLDLAFVEMPISFEEFDETFGNTLRNPVILYDVTSGELSHIITKVHEYTNFGKKLTETQLNNRHQYMLRTLRRMEGRVNEQEMFFLYLGYFYEKAIQYWFEVQGLWSLPIYDALPEIEKADLQYFNSLKLLASSTSAIEKLTTAQKIFSQLFQK